MKNDKIGFRTLFTYYILTFIELLILIGLAIFKFVFIDDVRFSDQIILAYGFDIAAVAISLILMFTILFDKQSPKEKTLIFAILTLIVSLSAGFHASYNILSPIKSLNGIGLIAEISFLLLLMYSVLIFWRILKIFLESSSKTINLFNKIISIVFCTFFVVLIIVPLILYFIYGIDKLCQIKEEYYFVLMILYSILAGIPIVGCIVCKIKKEYLLIFVGYSFSYIFCVLSYFLHFLSIVVCLIVALILIILRANFYSTLTDEIVEKELEISRLEIKAMVNQIKPHFLYNSLTAIMGIDDCGRETRYAIANFGDYLRGNLSAAENNVAVPFSKEFDSIKCYVQLEKLRFGDKIKITYDIGYDDFLIPSLSVQVLVENAIKHGSLSKKSGITIKVKTYKKGNDVLIEVNDNGVGFDVNKVLDDTHVGLRNLQQRLELISKGNLKIDSKINHGTNALITIPIQKKRK